MYLNVCNLIHRDLYPLVSRSSNFPFRNPKKPENSLISLENHHEHRRPHPIGPLKMTWENHCCSDAKNQKEHRKAAICSPGAIGGSMVWTSPDYSRASELVEGRICRAPLFFVAAKNPGSLWFPVRFSNLFHQPVHWQHDFAPFPYSARATSLARKLELVLPPGRSATNGSETFWNWRICRLKKPFYRNLILIKKHVDQHIWCSVTSDRVTYLTAQTRKIMPS